MNLSFRANNGQIQWIQGAAGGFVFIWWIWDLDHTSFQAKMLTFVAGQNRFWGMTSPKLADLPIPYLRPAYGISYMSEREVYEQRNNKSTNERTNQRTCPLVRSFFRSYKNRNLVRSFVFVENVDFVRSCTWDEWSRPFTYRKNRNFYKKLYLILANGWWDFGR